jgi:hypothetical protein
MDPGNLAGSRAGKCRGRARVQGGKPMWDTSGHGGDRIKGAEPVASQRSGKGERITPASADGGVKNLKNPTESVLMAEQNTNGYHPLVS